MRRLQSKLLNLRGSEILENFRHIDGHIWTYVDMGIDIYIYIYRGWNFWVIFPPGVPALESHRGSTSGSSSRMVSSTAERKSPLSSFYRLLCLILIFSPILMSCLIPIFSLILISCLILIFCLILISCLILTVSFMT